MISRSRRFIGLVLLLGLTALLGSAPAFATEVTLGDGPDLQGQVAIALDASASPAVVYYDHAAQSLKLARCGDPYCNSAPVITRTLAAVGDGSFAQAIALDASGYPVVVYTSLVSPGSYDLRLLRCNDTSCAPGGDTTRTLLSGVPLTWLRLRLDPAGFPVIGYDGGGFRLIHCNDAACDGGDETVTTPVATAMSGYFDMILDGAGYPLIAYTSSGNAYLVRCNDAGCAGGDDTPVALTTDNSAGPGWAISAALTSSNLPRVAYVNTIISTTSPTNQVLFCGSASCATITNRVYAGSPGSAGWGPTVQMSATGQQVNMYVQRTLAGSPGVIQVSSCTSACTQLYPGMVGFTSGVPGMALDAGGVPTVAYIGYAPSPFDPSPTSTLRIFRPPAAAPMVVTVFDDHDDGVCNSDCSFREAINAANAAPGDDTITFAPVSARTISLTSPLPVITGPVLINTYAVPNNSGCVQGLGPTLTIDGSGAGAGANGLVLAAGNSIVTYLAFNGFSSGSAILVTSDNNRIYCNFMSSASGLPHNQNGIKIDNAAYNVVGFVAAPYGYNVLNGNTQYGVWVTGAGSVGNQIVNNTMGVSSQTAVPNNVGIRVDGGATYTTIGANQISGNTVDGIQLAGSFNTVYANIIGTTNNGSIAISNGGSPTTGAGPGGGGITVTGSYNTIGGEGTAANQISGNKIGISLISGDGNVIRNNLIGLNGSLSRPDLTPHNGPLANYQGVYVEAHGTGAPNLIIDNVISGNTTVGVRVGPLTGTPSPALADNTLLSGNKIGTDQAGTASIPNRTGGVLLNGVSGTQLAYNLIARSSFFASTYGLQTSSASPSGSVGNCIYSNGVGLNNTTATAVTFTNNWWGAATGPVVGTDIKGTGQANVVFAPFLTSAPACGASPARSISVTPASQAFAPTLPGSSSAPATVTVNNTGSADVHVTSINTSSQFAVSNSTCGAALTVGGSCHFDVTFTPASAGPKLGTVSIYSDASGSPYKVSLSGAGAAPAITLDPDSHDFGGQLVNTTSAPFDVTLRNSGTAPLTVGTLTASAGFGVSNACDGAALNPGDTCVFAVTFIPTAAGAATGIVTITSNAATNPSLALTGAGTAPAVTLDPDSHDFGNQLVSTTSAPFDVTLRNSGTAPLTVGTLTASAGFGVSNACDGAALNPGDTCVFAVTFSPTTTGAVTGSVTLTSNAATNPSLALTGAGTAPAVTLDPDSHDFGGQLVNTTSAPFDVTLRNSGTAPLTVGTLTASAGFGVSNACDGAALNPGDTCIFAVTFTPTTTGAATGSVTLTSNAAANPSLPLTGTGTAPAVTLDPDSHDFGDQLVSTTSAPFDVTLRNSGTAPLTVGTLTASAGFGVSNACDGAALNPGDTCIFAVTFTPTTTGAATGSVTLTSNAAANPSLPLTGAGTAPAIALDPDSHDFGNQLINTASAPFDVTLRNSGTAPLTVGTLSASAGFGVSNTCDGAALNPGDTCVFAVTFSPTAEGAATGSVTLTSGAATNPSLTLTGAGTAPAIALDPASHDFGSLPAGQVSAPFAITVHNTGTGPLNVTGLDVTGEFAADLDTCSASIPASGSCSFNVTFNPATPGSKVGGVTIQSNAPGAPPVVHLSGYGLNGLSVPVLKTPKNGKPVLKRPVRFTWKAVKGVKAYHIRISQDPTFTTGVLEGDATKPKFQTSLPDFGIYYWEVASKDASGTLGAYSAPFSFTYTLNKSPKNGSRVTATPKFAWQAVKGKVYQLEIYTNPNDPAGSHAVEVPPNLAKPTFTVLKATPLARGQTYFWRVSIDGGSTWTPAWSFTVK